MCRGVSDSRRDYIPHIRILRCLDDYLLYSRENFTVWQRDTAVDISPAVFAIGVLVDVIAQVDDIVDGVFTHAVSVGIEEAEC